MGDKTGISWTDATWNPIRGCSKVSPGCASCYAETMAARFCGPGMPYEGTITNGRWNGTIKVIEDHMLDPLHWKRPRRIFVNSMSDLFHPETTEETIDRVFAVMLSATHHVYQILTKRPERMAVYVAGIATDTGAWRVRSTQQGEPNPTHGSLVSIRRGNMPPHIWLGTSIEDQPRADERLPWLQEIAEAGWNTFVSAEPLLGPIDFARTGGLGPSSTFKSDGSTVNSEGVRWVIIGGESGKNARPCELDWLRSIRDQCWAASRACFIKQVGADAYTDRTCTCGHNADRHWKGPAACPVCAGRLQKRDPKGGDMAEWPEDLRVREFPEGMVI